jgi:hypothetical protein
MKLTKPFNDVSHLLRNDDGALVNSEAGKKDEKSENY